MTSTIIGQVTADFVVVRIVVQPKAKRARILGPHGDRLKVSVTEPPDKGKANEAVVELLAEAFDLPPSRVSILRGHTSRQKDVCLAGVTEQAVQAVIETFTAS